MFYWDYIEILSLYMVYKEPLLSCLVYRKPLLFTWIYMKMSSVFYRVFIKIIVVHSLKYRPNCLKNASTFTQFTWKSLLFWHVFNESTSFSWRIFSKKKTSFVWQSLCKIHSAFTGFTWKPLVILHDFHKKNLCFYSLCTNYSGLQG